MSNMQYGRAVSGKSTSLNVNLSGTRIASYNPQSSRSSSGSGSTFTSSTSTLDLSAFLTDNIDETITEGKIEDSHHYDSYQSGWDKVQEAINEVGAAYTSDFEKAAATVVECGFSFLKGFFKVGENILDGVVQLGSNIVVGVLEAANYLGADIDTQAIKDSTQAFVSTDYVGLVYEEVVEKNEWIQQNSQASDTALAIFEGAGTITGYALVNAIPGVGGSVVAAFGAAGSAAENAYQCGATYGEASVVAWVAGGTAFAMDAGLDKLGKAAKGATTLKEVGKYTLAGAGMGTVEPTVNYTTQYLTYANDQVDENGNPLYDNYLDYMATSGYLFEAGVGSLIGAGSTGSKALKNYIKFQSISGAGAYIDKVVDKKTSNAVWDYAKQQYELKNGKGSFGALSDAERAKLLSEVDASTEAFTLKQKEYEQIARDTINSIIELESSGKLKPGYTAEDVLKMIEDGVPQENYLTQQAIDEWKAAWKPDANNNVEVYCFQDSSDSYALKDGTIGRPPNGTSTTINPAGDGGAFVMTKDQYDAILANRNIFDANGNCIDKKALSEALGGVEFFGNPVSIKQTVPMSSVEMPMGNNQGSFLGDWRPGGRTSGGVIEGVVPQNFAPGSSKGTTTPGTSVTIKQH